MPEILFTGRGTSGSWQIRGVQLGAALRGNVCPAPDVIPPCDIAVLVKRPPAGLLERLHTAKVPVVWDIVDAWPQPHGNDWDRAACLAWLRQTVDAMRPAALVAATEQMARDCEEFGLPLIALRHHARPKQEINPIRERVRRVGYEGSPHYLGPWRPSMERACKARGWEFIVNPPQLSDLDIVVALREAQGYAAREWKSGVKLANAQGSGTPCILSRAAGYTETASGAEKWADTMGEMNEALDALTPRKARAPLACTLHRAAPLLPEISHEYGTWLQQLTAGGGS